jgi:hypothetical protein
MVRSTKQRVWFALGLATLAAIYVIFKRWDNADGPSDLTQVWVGARAWLAGENPYEAVRMWGQWPFPLLYPFPAALVLVPFTVLPPWVADALFAGVGTGLLAWGSTREADAPRLVMFLSAPLLYALSLGQWSPLLVGATLVPWAGFVLVCKPTIGLALCMAYPQRRMLIGCAIMVGGSVLLWPGWIGAWRVAIAQAPNAVAPITLPGGMLALLALLKWRRPEARLLAVLACVPHTTLSYEALPLFLVPVTWPEAAIVWVGTFVAHVGHRNLGPYSSQLAWVQAGGLWLVWAVYVPCLIMVLRRPNVGLEWPLGSDVFRRWRLREAT